MFWIPTSRTIFYKYIVCYKLQINKPTSKSSRYKGHILKPSFKNLCPNPALHRRFSRRSIFSSINLNSYVTHHTTLNPTSICLYQKQHVESGSTSAFRGGRKIKNWKFAHSRTKIPSFRNIRRYTVVIIYMLQNIHDWFCRRQAFLSSTIIRIVVVDKKNI